MIYLLRIRPVCRVAKYFIAIIIDFVGRPPSTLSTPNMKTNVAHNKTVKEQTKQQNNKKKLLAPRMGWRKVLQLKLIT